MTPLTFEQTQTRNTAIQTALDLVKTGYWVLDLETTGTGKKAEVVEIAILDETKKVIFHSFVLPQGKISKGAFETHGLSREVLEQKSAPSWAEIIDKVKTLLATTLNNHPIVIHNKKFDLRILKQNDLQLHPDTDVVCSMELSKAITPNQVALNGSHGAAEDCKDVIERIIYFTQCTLQEYQDITPDEAGETMAEIDLIDTQIKMLEIRKAVLAEKMARLMDRDMPQLTYFEADKFSAEWVVGWTNVQPGDGYSLEQVAEKYPNLVNTIPSLKPSAGRSIPKLIRDNGGDLPSVLTATQTRRLKIAKLKD